MQQGDDRKEAKNEGNRMERIKTEEVFIQEMKEGIKDKKKNVGDKN